MITLPMELVLLVESSLVLVLAIGCDPLQNTLSPCSISVMSFEIMMFGFLLAEAVKGVVLEATSVGKVLGFIESLTFKGLCFVVVELSTVVRAVIEDKDSSTLGVAMLEVSNVETAVFFVHFTETMRADFVLNKGNITSSSYPS